MHQIGLCTLGANYNSAPLRTWGWESPPPSAVPEGMAHAQVKSTTPEIRVFNLSRSFFLGGELPSVRQNGGPNNY